MDIAEGYVRAFYLFDVADTIDLSAISAVSGQGLERATIPLRQHSSNAYLQFPVPPLTARLPDVRVGGLDGTVRVKLFDYGVISLRLSFPANGTWEQLSSLADVVRRSDTLSRYALDIVTQVMEDLGAALDDPHPPLVEDYFVIDVERFGAPVDCETLLRDRADALANILLGERGPLARQEIEESLRVRFSYNADDLTIVQWDTAFIYDRRESSDAIQDILEFANSQLLELRTYDTRLDDELDIIYKMQPGHQSRSLLGRREAEQAATLRYLIVDVLELIDRSTNALKLVGDAYYARIYRAAAARLGLSVWQSQIDSKLASVGDMYRFFIDQSRIRRDEFLEIIVIVLIALELIVGIATLVRH